MDIKETLGNRPGMERHETERGIELSTLRVKLGQIWGHLKKASGS